jgi:hypothetical protein
MTGWVFGANQSGGDESGGIAEIVLIFRLSIENGQDFVQAAA